MAYGISRRDFLITTAAGAATLVLAGCQQPRRWVTLEPYVRPPEEQLAGAATWYASTCRQCPAGCGILVRVMNGRALKIEGNPEHPLNRGKLCARGQSGLQLLYNPDRLPGPVRQDVRGSREYRAISWDEGLNELLTMVQEGGPRLAVWLGSTTSAHLYQIFNDFTAALGAPNPVVFDLYTAMTGYVALRQNVQTLFGQDGLPAYDLEQADVVYSFGSDILGTWLSAVRYGVEYGAFRSQPLGKRGYLAQFEPRMSTTAAKADLWVPIPPGSEGLIAQALISSMAEGTYGSGERVARAQALAADVNLEDVSAAVGIPVEEITRLARTFIEAERPLALPGTNPQAVASV